MVKQVLPYLGGAVIGFLISWILLPREPVNTETYELKSEIQELKYQVKIDSIKIKYAADFTQFEYGDSTYRDSILLDLGF